MICYEGNENKENPKMWPVEVFICDILSVYEHQFAISSVLKKNYCTFHCSNRGDFKGPQLHLGQ